MTVSVINHTVDDPTVEEDLYLEGWMVSFGAPVLEWSLAPSQANLGQRCANLHKYFLIATAQNPAYVIGQRIGSDLT